jgi:hypothetical protein
MNQGVDEPNLSQRARGETEAHRALKKLALAWAGAHRLPLSGVEVRVPKSPYRADVAAASRHPAADDGIVAVFECKQARADFLRDEADEPAVRLEATAIASRLAALKSLIGVHRPDLRRGESLFAEFDDYDFRDLRHPTLHALERKLDLLQGKLVESVKFARLHRYNAADYLYLVTENEVVAPHEIPCGWGWLVRRDQGLELRQPPVRHATTPAQRLAWLESIAAAGARATRKTNGLASVNPPRTATTAAASAQKPLDA